MKLLLASLRLLRAEAASLLKIDIPAALMVAALLALLLPHITRHADNAAMLHTFVDDEPLLTMQIDGMTAWPWGNPSTYLDARKHVSHPVPAHWLNIRYDGIVYYGGLYLDLAALVWTPLKIAGLPIFPTVPIILRTLSLLFAAFTILAVYNFGRKNFGLFAGLFGGLLLLTEFHFIALGSFAHPDTLLFFLTVLALPLCLRHAREGTTESLVAIGIVAGLAQGAKMGGPLLVPIVVAAIVYSTQNVPTILRRGAAVFGAAVAVFFLTTPYALVDPYFRQSWTGLTALFSGQSPIQVVTFTGWLLTVVSKVGVPLLITAGIALAAAMLPRSKERLPLLFAALLAAWIIAWYALFQRFWVQPQYLIVSYALIAVVGWSLADRLVALLPIPRAAIALIAVCTIAAVAATHQSRVITGAFSIPVIMSGWRDAPQYQVGEWLSRNKQGGDTVLFDTQAYFDPKDFPRQFANGGPIKWDTLERVKPDYFALTIYGPYHWMAQKMASQRSEQWDPDYYNMRLYQDLLGTDPGNPTPTNALPHITALRRFDPPKTDTECDTIFAKIACAVNASMGDGMGGRGPTTWLFKLDHSEMMKRVSETSPYKTQ